jgi:AcrR family transcriptional regulator
VRPRTKPSEVRREELMDAAAALFIAKGVEATTVDEIVAAADVAKGTFYHYFQAKPDVVAALRERFSQGFLTRVGTALDAAPPGPARLRRWVEASVDGYLDGHALHDVVFHDYNHQQRRSKEKDGVLDQVEAVLVAGIRAGSWQVEDTRLAAILLFDGMHGAVDAAIVAGDADRAGLSRRLSALFLRMLGAEA